jgi:flagellar motility protein MotE (MotC chaperone)
VATTKAAEIYDKVEALVASGTPKAEAFKQLAKEYGQPVDSMRGAYYGEKRKREGGGKPSRTRRRETTPEDAVADARGSLERAIEAIDREIEASKERMDEAKAEYEALKASAADRKKAITERLEVLV